MPQLGKEDDSLAPDLRALGQGQPVSPEDRADSGEDRGEIRIPIFPAWADLGNAVFNYGRHSGLSGGKCGGECFVSGHLASPYNRFVISLTTRHAAQALLSLDA
jgi:hypothetical protein